MKKLYIIALSVLALAVGCQREEIAAPDTDASVQEVYATTEDMPDTKTYMSGTEVYWSSGDRIAVFYKNTLRKRFDVTPESVASKNATFLEDTDYNMIGSSTSISNNVAYYPFCDVICAAEGASYVLSNISLPAVQNYAPGSAGLGAYPMVAVTENTEDVNFRFRNVCGALMFQLKGYGFIRSVSIKGNSDEVLAGSAKVTAAYGKDPELALSSDSEADKTVTIDCGEAGVELDAETPVSFVFSLPPDALSGGFTITVTDIWGGSKEYSTSKPNTILRSKIRRMPPQEYIGVRPPQEGDYIDEYGVNHGQGVEIDGVVWAPVNCGYHKDNFKYGKLYQWGRKYGQGYDGNLYDVNGSYIDTYSDATVPTIEEGGVSVVTGNHKSKENIFYTGTSSYNYDWVDPQDGKLWNSGSESKPVKTEYDPCPAGWRVPTYAELDELRTNRSSWTTNADGQVGYWLSGASTYSSDVPQVFFPAAGKRQTDGYAVYRGYYGYYWSSRPSSYGAYYLYFLSGTANMSNFRCALGHSVRCVQDDSELIPVSSVTLDKISVTMAVGQTQAVVATITPANANHQSAHWWSDDKSIATVDSEGNITAVSEGTVTITAMAGMQTAECEVKVIAVKDYIDENNINQGKGVLIGDVVWAPVNCGYHKTDFKYGKLYQWGRKYGQGYSGDFYDGDRDQTYSDAIVPTVVSGPVDLATGQSKNNENIFYVASSSSDDWLSPHHNELWNSGTEENPVKTEYDPCPVGWRVPTYAELNELCQNYSSWTSVEGQPGYWFRGASSYTENVPQVFFPAAGYRNYNGPAYYRGYFGIYWSSRPYNDRAYNLLFSSSTVNMYNLYGRAYGYSVRCVQVID